MNSQGFADYILSEQSYGKKLEIMYYAHKKMDIFLDTSVIFKTEVCRMFLEHQKIDVDTNLVLTACLLYACKKSAINYDLAKVKTYAKEGSEYLATLGFEPRFCKICLEVNRHVPTEKREKESDILELVDNLGMLLDREDRMYFTPEEAVYMMENKNLRDKYNRYLEDFKEFIREVENVTSLGLDKNRIISRWQKVINAIPKYDIASSMNLAIENRIEARKIYIEGRKIEKDKNGIRSRGRVIKEQLADQIDVNKKFSELLD